MEQMSESIIPPSFPRNTHNLPRQLIFLMVFLLLAICPSGAQVAERTTVSDSYTLSLRANLLPTGIESDLTTALQDFNSDKTEPLTLGGKVEIPDEAGVTATIEDWRPATTGKSPRHPTPASPCR